MKKQLVTIAASVCLILAVVALSVASCAEVEPGPTPGPGPTPPTPPVGEPQYGGDLRIGSVLSPPILFPNRMVGGDPDPILYTVIECFARWGAGGEFVPWLATSWEEDAEAKTITVHLREGVKFHDGSDFDAEAAKWSLDYLLSDLVRGHGAFIAALESTEVIDDYTIRVHIEPYQTTTLQQVLRHKFVSPTAYEKNGMEWAELNPVGTGPFKFVSWKRNVNIKFERFDDYWGGKPYLDTVEWIEYKDSMVLMASFLAGEVDAVIMVDPKDATEIAEYGKFTVQTCPGELQVFLPDGDHDYSVWSNLLVRQAGNYAIDRQAICDAVGYGYWRPAFQHSIGPEHWSYNPDVEGYPYNPEKARELLAEAGYPDGFKTTLYRESVPLSEVLAATAVQGYLNAVGIDTHLELLEHARFAEIAAGGGWENGIASFWIKTSSPGILNNQNVFYHEGSIYFPSALKPKEYTDLLAKTVQEADFEKRKAMVWELQYLMVDKYAFAVQIYQTTSIAVKYPELHGDGLYEITRMQWIPETAWLSK